VAAAEAAVRAGKDDSKVARSPGLLADGSATERLNEEDDDGEEVDQGGNQASWRIQGKSEKGRDEHVGLCEEGNEARQ